MVPYWYESVVVRRLRTVVESVIRMELKQACWVSTVGNSSVRLVDT
jgi:hypothetical protein